MASHTNRLNGAVSTSDGLATLKAIRREILPDAVRVTLELEREAMFYEERLENPARVFVDLKNTRTVDALKDATIAFEDDVVRQARIGRQPDNRTRIVFDLQGAGRYSVYSLYNPNRVVIDFERTKGTKETKGTKTEAAPVAASGPPSPGPTTAPPATAAAPASAQGSGAAPPATAAANARGGYSLSRQLGLGISRVVIDPGHGGHDPGAQVRGLNEAELVLDIAQRLERLLVNEPGVEVVLTRRTNAYVALEERTAIANRSAADLFLSIHANASANAGVRGFETYFLNFAPNSEAEAIAARENAGSARRMGSLPDIVKAIALNNKIDESRDFASMVQASMHDLLRKTDRNARNLGVKQAPFMVLIGATMPSVLVEVSFLTNRDEATLLRSQNYRQQIAEALFAGVMKYGNSLRSRRSCVLGSERARGSGGSSGHEAQRRATRLHAYAQSQPDHAVWRLLATASRRNASVEAERTCECRDRAIRTSLLRLGRSLTCSESRRCGRVAKRRMPMKISPAIRPPTAAASSTTPAIWNIPRMTSMLMSFAGGGCLMTSTTIGSC